MDQRNNKIQQFNIPPFTAYESGNRYISSTVHNGMQGISCPQTITTMASQPSYLQASMHNQNQQMLLMPNGAPNSGNMMMHNPQQSVGYQIRQPVVTLRTETNYFRQQTPTAVHARYITPAPQQPMNTNYASNQNPLLSMNNMMTGTTLKRTEAMNTMNISNMLPRTLPQNQPSNVNQSKQVMSAPQLPLPSKTTDKVTENLMRLQKFLKQIVQDKHNLSHYLKEGTVENLNLIAILCHAKFRSEFLRLSNNEKLKMQIRNRMMSESGKSTLANPDSLNTVRSKSIQDILYTLLALTWIHPTNQDSQSSVPPVDKSKVTNNVPSQPITSQNPPSHSHQQVTQSRPPPPVKAAPSNAMSNIRVKREPGLEAANKSNCSGSGSSFSTGDQMKSLTQPSAPNNMYANFEDFVRMSDEAAEPIDSMFEPIVKEDAKQRDVKPIVSNLLTSATVAPKVPPANSTPMYTNRPEQPDVKPVITPKTQSNNNYSPLSSVPSSQKIQSIKPNSNSLVQSSPCALSNESDMKPKIAKPYVYSPLPENSLSKATEIKMTSAAPVSSTSDNFLKTLEELQKDAFNSLEATSSSPSFPQVTNQNIPNTNPISSLHPSLTKILASAPVTTSSVMSSVIASVISSVMSSVTSSLASSVTSSLASSVTSSVTSSFISPVTSVTSSVTSLGTSSVTPSSVNTALRDKKKNMVRPLSPNNMCRVEAEDQHHICSSLVESGLSDKKMKDLIKVKKGEVICSLSSKMKPNPEATATVNCERSHFWCNFCVYQTDNKLRLINHVIAAHRFSCQFCKFQCFSRAEVFEHTVSHHQQAGQMSKEFKLCVLLPDYLKMLEKIENLENDNFEADFIQSLKRNRNRAGPSSSSNSLESDWEDEFLDDESESEVSDIESDDSSRKKSRKRKKQKNYSNSDDETADNQQEKKKSISEAFEELQKQRKKKKKKRNNIQPRDRGDADMSSNSTSADLKSNLQESTKKQKKRDRKKKVKPTEAKMNKKRPSRRTAGKWSNNSSQSFMALEAMLSGEENQLSDLDDDDKDADFVPDTDSEKHKKRKLIDSSPIQITKTPRVVLTKFNLLKRCIHCDYSNGEIQPIKLHSLHQHCGSFLGVWQDSLDILLYICPNRFCDFYGSSFNDYLNHLEKCNYDKTDDILDSVTKTQKYIKCLKEKRIIKPTTIDSLRQMIVKCLEPVETVSTSTASTAIVESNPVVQNSETTITAFPSNSNSSVDDMDMKSTSTDVSKPTTSTAASKPVISYHASKDFTGEEIVFKCAFCAFKSLALPLGVRTHTVKCHPEFPLYAINLKCVEEGRDNRFVLFCVGVDCEAQFLESSDYFKHIETCEAVKKLTDDTQLLKTNKFVKSTIHRL